MSTWWCRRTFELEGLWCVFLLGANTSSAGEPDEQGKCCKEENNHNSNDYADDGNVLSVK